MQKLPLETYHHPMNLSTLLSTLHCKKLLQHACKIRGVKVLSRPTKMESGRTLIKIWKLILVYNTVLLKYKKLKNG
jgi:hypothetical protein